jgi:hypothetical protein
VTSAVGTVLVYAIILIIPSALILEVVARSISRRTSRTPSARARRGAQHVRRGRVTAHSDPGAPVRPAGCSRPPDS